MTVDHPLTLAIDLGTSGCKAALVDLEGTLVATGKAPVTTLRLEDGGVEQDPEQVWLAVRDACRQALAIGRREDVVAVAIDSQYSSLIPVDIAGRPTMNMILWQDQRGAPASLGLSNGPLTKLRWIYHHGIPPLDAGLDSLSHARFLALRRPEIYARTATLLEPADYLAMRLTGHAASNPCTAFLQLLVDNRDPQLFTRPRYHPGLCRASGIDSAKLPPLLPIDAEVGEVLPDVAAELGLPAGVRVTAPVNDTCAAGMGCGAFQGSHAGLSIGTTSVIVTHVDAQRTDVRNAIVSMPSPLPGVFLVMAENGIGGRALEHFLEQLIFAHDGFGDHDLADKFAALHRALEATEPGAGGVLFLPWLTGSLAPAEDARVRGGFLNLSLDTRRADLGQAVLEGVAFNFRWLRDPVEAFVRRRLSHLYFYGGGAKSDRWAQILADVLQLPVHQARDPDYVACRGLGLLTFHRRGLLTLDEVAARVPVSAIREPRPAYAERYRLLFDQYRRAFFANRRIFHALHRLP